MNFKITSAIASGASQSDSSDNQASTASKPSIGANADGVLTPDEYTTKEDTKERDFQEPCCYKFQWSSLWRRAEVNPINGKSFTFPLFRVWDPYSTAFWLATLGFFVAFLSWFTFSPLMPEAVKADLNLTQDQVINSNLASLGGTATVRLIAGPACDRFGPRKVLATLLILGAIPSGLAALVTNISGLETVRFFISILGGAFVPTQAYTTTFFDKSIVGTANAFSGGWGNLGGGVTVAAMIGLYDRYTKAGYSSHLSWRLCLLSIPVPCLCLVAVTVLLLGRDHPAGKWSARHQFSSTAMTLAQRDESALDADASDKRVASLDSAQSEPLTCATLLKILADLRVWMCASCYLLTFGLETAMDAALPGLMNTLFASKTFTVVDAAYAASTYGLLNLFARPLGGIVSDLLYARFGLRAKVYWLLATTLSQGIAVLGLGIYINHSDASIGGVIGFIVLIAITGFAANGACYSVYGHLRPKNIGAVAGIVGAGGNFGGLLYTLIFKYQPGRRLSPSPVDPHGYNSLGTKFWIAGVVNAVSVLPFLFVGLGDAV
ncbi:major facilitator superfamily protein [Hirsutella rhossiliensis]|uniref:Major facilitator superfamily domain-containing protein n=1 Tax=Hirsutella rhossiliensis TaxID=111463 RepID=A0A9P8MZK7_9HYPO|nr:major facilitator superfamily domain-containing protein [Hirsutella rhossiliensis]KAH0963892.1 major facilitator superfamily domain-containing protein [Hirsutella rhossiliensis]